MVSMSRSTVDWVQVEIGSRNASALMTSTSWA